MKINKSLDIDLNILSPQKHIRIHEGDVDSVNILIGVSVDDESVDLDDVNIKYDATINNYLAEQDADGSVVNDKISIPVTQNMTAMSGLLLIDVRMIQSDQILFTQTIYATVEKAVVNGSTYIDFDKITINQRMNALEEKMEHVEELVENFDTSKLIVSTNRPPSGAPPEVDVDLLRVGDTWIQHGDEKIVYKLVEAAYHFRPYPTAEPYHKFTWQTLNERHIISNTEPPETVTYQEVDYSVDGVAWSWFPVQDYFQSDHYAQQITADESTYYICEDAVLNSYNTGICYYVWREEGGSGDISTKMDLAPLNPTVEQIASMPSGQLYSDTVNHKGVVKNSQSFYDTVYIDENYRKTYTSDKLPPYYCSRNDTNNMGFNLGDKWVFNPPSNQGYSDIDHREYVLTRIERSGMYGLIYRYIWVPTTRLFSDNQNPLPTTEEPIDTSYTINGKSYNAYALSRYSLNDVFLKNGAYYVIDAVYKAGISYASDWVYQLRHLMSETEIDNKGYLTLETLPIYDGTVI